MADEDHTATTIELLASRHVESRRYDPAAEPSFRLASRHHR